MPMCHGGGGQEQRQPLASSQAGPGGGQPGSRKSEPVPLAHARQARASLCSACSREHPRPRRASKQDCLCTHTLTHLYTKHSTTHTRHAHTHTVTHTHAITYTCTLACKHAIMDTPHHAHTHACAHCHVYILQVVALWGAWHSSFSGGRPPPGLQDTAEPHHMPTAPATSTQFRRLC